MAIAHTAERSRKLPYHIEDQNALEIKGKASHTLIIFALKHAGANPDLADGLQSAVKEYRKHTGDGHLTHLATHCVGPEADIAREDITASLTELSQDPTVDGGRAEAARALLAEMHDELRIDI